MRGRGLALAEAVEMDAIRRMLVAVDFSKCSEHALTEAMDLGVLLGAQVDVLHTWEPSPYLAPTAAIYVGDGGEPFWKTVHEEIDKQLAELVERCRADRKLTIERFVVSGYPSSTILAALEDRPYDLAVVGTHGRNWLAHVLLGSVAAEIVRHAPCPVLTVREPHAESARASGLSSVPVL
jgi:nucleotide-binding universal stress UspA family protein